MSIFGDAFEWAKGAVQTVAETAVEVVKTAAPIASIAIESVKAVTNNPLWDIAATGASFIPGIGSAVSSGMSVVAAVGQGQSIANIGLAAARGALPGGPMVKVAWDIGVGMVGSQLADAAVGEVEKQIRSIAGGDSDVAVDAFHAAREAAAVKPKTPEELERLWAAKRTSRHNGMLRQAHKLAREGKAAAAAEKARQAAAMSAKVHAAALAAVRSRAKLKLIQPKIQIDAKVHAKNVATFKARLAAYNVFEKLAKIDALASAKDPKTVAWVNTQKAQAKKGDKKSTAVLKGLTLVQQHAKTKVAKPKVAGLEVGAWYYEHPYPDAASKPGSLDHTYFLGRLAELGLDAPGEQRKGNWLFSYPAH